MERESIRAAISGRWFHRAAVIPYTSVEDDAVRRSGPTEPPLPLTP
jgi:hypothetical protein